MSTAFILKTLIEGSETGVLEGSSWLGKRHCVSSKFLVSTAPVPVSHKLTFSSALSSLLTKINQDDLLCSFQFQLSFGFLALGDAQDEIGRAHV